MVVDRINFLRLQQKEGEGFEHERRLRNVLGYLTPTKADGFSPAEKFLGRRTNTKLPIPKRKLKTESADLIRKELQKSKQRQTDEFRHIGRTEIRNSIVVLNSLFRRQQRTKEIFLQISGCKNENRKSNKEHRADR